MHSDLPIPVTFAATAKPSNKRYFELRDAGFSVEESLEILKLEFYPDMITPRPKN